jgi:hypothetical protein
MVELWSKKATKYGPLRSADFFERFPNRGRGVHANGQSARCVSRKSITNMEPFFIVKRVTISGNGQWMAASGRCFPRESPKKIRVLPIEQTTPLYTIHKNTARPFRLVPRQRAQVSHWSQCSGNVFFIPKENTTRMRGP